MRIAAAEVHDPVLHDRRSLHADLIVDAFVDARLEAPFFGAGFGVESVKEGIPATEIHHAIDNRRGRVDDIARRELPA